MTITVFENCNLLDGVTADIRDGMHVVVEDDRIRDVSDQPVKLKEAHVIDGRGRTLMPGLIDAHVHVFAVKLNQAATANMPLTQMTAMATQRIKAMLDRGFTTVRDVAGADYGIRDAIAQGFIPRSAAFISGRRSAQTGGHGDHAPAYRRLAAVRLLRALHRLRASRTDRRRAPQRPRRDAQGRGPDQALVSGGVGSPNDPLESRQYSADEIRAAVDEATAWNTYVTAHSYTSRSTIQPVECGVRCIEHGNLVDAAAARVMAEHGAFWCRRSSATRRARCTARSWGCSPVVMEKLRIVNEAGSRCWTSSRRRRQDGFRHRPDGRVDTHSARVHDPPPGALRAPRSSPPRR